jgi:hypothetical protein
MVIRPILLGFCASALMLAATNPSQPTFYKDVLPVLQKRCQQCHRPGEPAPMSLLTYQQVQPWAKAIREALLTHKMPPWPADPRYGHFANDRSLSRQELDTVVSWVDAGARVGDPAEAPPPAHFIEGWGIDKPDAVFTMPHEFHVPASGVLQYQYIVIPSGFTEDKWVQEAEARPGNRKLVHHMIAYVRPPGSQWLKDAQPGIPYVPPQEDREARRRRRARERNSPPPELLVGFAPGLPPAILRPGQAKLVKAGSDFVFQMHYTADGKPDTDRSSIGLVFAKQPPMERVFTTSALNDKFVIAAGAPDQEVESEVTLYKPAKLVDMMPHMHMRGKDFTFIADYPDGHSEVLLKVPHYNFHWQLLYTLAEEKLLPAGTRIHCVAHFDNSRNNPANPDPTKEVRWGDQSWDEMMIGWFDVAIPVNQNPLELFVGRKHAHSSD